MRKLKLLLLAMLLTLFNVAFAQTRTITGKVIDDTGNPVANASVILRNSANGVATNLDGEFSILVPGNKNILLITAVGMQDKAVEINEQTNITVVMKNSNAALEEVVVVGYGSGRSRATVVGSIDRISNVKLKDRPAANAIDGLQGQLPGLQVFTSSGEPSVTPSFRLHGVGSLGASSTPLILLDGVQISASSIVSLNPQDIESYTLLKDASSTSIYGSRAANGVLLLTSKKGASGQPTTINAQIQYGIVNLLNKDYYRGFMNTKELTDFWVATGQRSRGYVDTLLTKFPNDTHWEDVYYKSNTAVKQANLSVSGGKDLTNYFLSGGYYDEDGMAYRSGFKRYTMRSNLNTGIGKWLRFGVNISVGYDERQSNQYGSNSTNRGLAMLAQPFYSPVDSNGKRFDLIPGWGRYHPEYLADVIPYLGKNIQFNPSTYIELRPFKNFILKTQVGYDGNIYRESFYQKPSYLGSLNNGNATETNSQSIQRTVTNTAEYSYSLQNIHNFNALAGYEFIDYKYDYFSAASSGQSDDRLVMLTAGPNNRNVNQAISQYAYRSFFGRFGYNFDKKYLLDLSLRQDESSRFGANKKQATFWSVGLMWNAKNEKFIQDIKWLNDLSVRANTGTSGNSDIGNYLSQALVSTSQYDGQTGWYLGTPGNSLLAWENQQKSVLGLQFGIFDRIRIDFLYYFRKTSSQLVSVPYPYTSGFASITSNVGTLQNKGFDFRIDYDAIKSDDAFFAPYITAAYNRNKITELFQGRNYWIVPNTGVAWVVGQEINYIYPVFAGIDKTTGQPTWYQPAGSNPEDVVKSQFDPSKVVTGNANFSSASLQQNTGIGRYAPWSGGFGFQSGWKGLSLNADFSFVKGKYLINNDRYFFENPGQFPGFNQLKTIQDYWKQAGDNTRFPKYGEQFTQFDSRLIEDASFMRLKTIMLSYRLPKNIMEKTGFVKSTRIFIVGRNLLTYTKYSGPDPEVDSNLTLGVNPNVKQVSFGIDLQF